MFFQSDIKAGALERKTLSLTFDDGPGPATTELARYLAREGVRATFFVIGRHVARYAGVIELLVEMGHLVGNHTLTHPNLRDLGYGAAYGEIRETHRLLADVVQSGPHFFRAPWGHWPGESPNLPDLLNLDPDLGRYVGPIHWDVDGHDYDHWELGRSVTDCAASYRQVIAASKGAGIVLMHDSRHDGNDAAYRPLELMKELLPTLRAEGYEFLRLDEMPGIRGQV
jgi:peptidoglycan/xylan/chitin deacetylase (PgdA/CDA1 family)